MKRPTIPSDRFKIGLAVFWFLFTFSMVTWWWIFSLEQLSSPEFQLPVEKMHKLRRMILWEGSFLLAFVFGGGASLLVLTNRERLRNLRLRMFFSNFSHDLKTSLSRLRLRAEVLMESDQNPKLQKLMEEVHRLDLQLENSLWVARGEEQKLLTQKCVVSDILSNLRLEWPELQIHLQQEAVLSADKQAVQSIFRNLIQNSWLHGKASQVNIQVKKLASNEVQLTFLDNGSGFHGHLPTLGKQILPSQMSSSQGNGIGLYLTQFLLNRMNGHISFHKSDSGFEVQVTLPGESEPTR